MGSRLTRAPRRSRAKGAGRATSVPGGGKARASGSRAAKAGGRAREVERHALEAPDAGWATGLGKWLVWGLVLVPPFLVSPTADDAFRLPKTLAAETLALLSLARARGGLVESRRSIARRSRAPRGDRARGAPRRRGAAGRDHGDPSTALAARDHESRHRARRSGAVERSTRREIAAARARSPGGAGGGARAARDPAGARRLPSVRVRPGTGGALSAHLARRQRRRSRRLSGAAGSRAAGRPAARAHGARPRGGGDRPRSVWSTPWW